MGRRTALAACLCGFLLVVPVLHASDSTGASNGEQLLLAEINRARAAHGLRALRYDRRLHAAARAHSSDMVAHGYFGHGNFGRRLQNYGVRGRALGENVAWAAGATVNGQVVVAQWLASPSHRANLLSRAFRRVGVGAAVGSFGGYPQAYVVTADFSG